MTNKNALQGAEFELKNEEKNYYFKTTIDDKLVLPNLPEGEYEYKLSKKGYKTIKNTFTLGKYQHANLLLDLEETKKSSKKSTKKPTK